jgi:hypothetical protein
LGHACWVTLVFELRPGAVSFLRIGVILLGLEKSQLGLSSLFLDDRAVQATPNQKQPWIENREHNATY